MVNSWCCMMYKLITQTTIPEFHIFWLNFSFENDFIIKKLIFAPKFIFRHIRGKPQRWSTLKLEWKRGILSSTWTWVKRILMTTTVRDITRNFISTLIFFVSIVVCILNNFKFFHFCIHLLYIVQILIKEPQSIFLPLI